MHYTKKAKFSKTSLRSTFPLCKTIQMAHGRNNLAFHHHMCTWKCKTWCKQNIITLTKTNKECEKPEVEDFFNGRKFKYPCCRILRSNRTNLHQVVFTEDFYQTGCEHNVYKLQEPNFSLKTFTKQVVSTMFISCKNQMAT